MRPSYESGMSPSTPDSEPKDVPCFGDGVHTGDALREGDHFFGTTVHYAARVASHAIGGEMLVSNLVRELVAGPGIEFVEIREVELKGLEGLHRLFAVDLG